jgi:hypothetical protein
MLPVGFSGAGDRLDIQHADAPVSDRSFAQSSRTTLEMGLAGHLEPFNGFLLFYDLREKSSSS